MILCSHRLQIQLLSDHNLQRLAAAVLAEWFVGPGGAIDAGGLYLHELAKHVIFVHLGNVSILGVVSREEGIDIGDDICLLEKPLKRRFYLFLNVVIEVDWNIFLKDFDWILSIFIVFGSFLTLDNHIANSVSNIQRNILITLLHFSCQLNMSLLHFIGILASIFP